MKTLLLTLTTCLGVQAAPAVPGALRVNFDTTGTNTTSVAVTVAARTNLLAGTLTATNSAIVGVAGSTNGVVSITGALFLGYAPDGSASLSNWWGGGAGSLVLSGTNYNQVYLSSENAAGDVYGWVGFDFEHAANTFARQFIQSSDGVVISGHRIEAIPGDPYYVILNASDELMSLRPGSLTLPYSLSTLAPLPSDKNLIEINNHTNLQFAVSADSGWTGTGTNFLSDDGTVKPMGGTTINPTDGYLPYRFDANTFADSPWNHIDTNRMGFYTTNVFLYSNEDDVALSMGVNGQQAGLFANTSFGHNAFENLTTGIENNAFGFHALWSVTEGSYNSAFGTSSLLLITDGSENTAFGNGTLNNLLSGDGNVAVGLGAGQELQLGSNNTIVGNKAQSNNPLTYTNLSNVIVIGAGVRATNDNEIIIGNSTNTTAIFNIASFSGTGTNFLSDNGTYTNVASNGFGSTAPDAPVEITATGWTNTLGKNAVVFLNGTSPEFIMYNGAGSAVYTNPPPTGPSLLTIPLQVNGAIVIIGGSGISGVAVPW